MAGVRFFLTRHIAVFSEYKYVRTQDFEFTRISEPGTVAGAPALEIDKVKLHLNTHMLTLGLAYHW